MPGARRTEPSGKGVGLALASEGASAYKTSAGTRERMRLIPAAAVLVCRKLRRERSIIRSSPIADLWLVTDAPCSTPALADPFPEYRLSRQNAARSAEEYRVGLSTLRADRTVPCSDYQSTFPVVNPGDSLTSGQNQPDCTVAVRV